MGGAGTALGPARTHADAACSAVRLEDTAQGHQPAAHRYVRCDHAGARRLLHGAQPGQEAGGRGRAAGRAVGTEGRLGRCSGPAEGHARGCTAT